MRQANRLQISRRPRPQTPFPSEPMAMISSDPGDRGPGGPGPLGGRSHHRQPQQKRHRHARRAHHQVHDPAAPARRARRRTRPAGHHRQDAAPAQTPAQQPDPGPGSEPPCTNGRRPRWTWPSTSATRTPRGSAAPTRTPTAPRQYFLKGTDPSVYPEDYLTRSPRNSTTGHAKPSGS